MKAQAKERTRIGKGLMPLCLLLICSCQGTNDRIAIGNDCYVNIVGNFKKRVAEDGTYYWDDNGSSITYAKEKGDMFSKELPWGSIEVEERLFNGVNYRHAVHTMSKLNAKEDIYFIDLSDGQLLLKGPIVKNGIADVLICGRKID